MEHGYYTAELGKMLKRWLDEEHVDSLEVFYDHGREGMSKIVPYFGKYSRATTLANVDCAVVDTSRRQTLVLCEIEEEGASPKKVIGDIGNLLIADWLCIGGQRYSFHGAHVIIGTCVKDGGQSEAKAKAIRRRLKSMAGPERLRGLNIYVQAEADAETLIKVVYEEIQDVVRDASKRSVSTSSRRASPPRPCRLRSDSRRTRF